MDRQTDRQTDRTKNITSFFGGGNKEILLKTSTSLHYATPVENDITTTTTILRLSGFCPGLPGWAGTRGNIHPLTTILIVNHPSSAFTIYCDPWHPPCSIDVPDSLFAQPLSKSSWQWYFIHLHIPEEKHTTLLAVEIITVSEYLPRMLHQKYKENQQICYALLVKVLAQWTQHTHTHTTILRLCGLCPVQPGWAGTRRHISPSSGFYGAKWR